MFGRSHRERAPRLALAAAVLSAVALAAPSAANAAAVSSDGQTITYSESPANEVNDVSIVPGAGFVDFSDSAGIDVGSGCSVAPGGESARCPLGAGGVQLSTGGGNDGVIVQELNFEQLVSGALRVDLGDGDDRFAGDGAGTEDPNGPGEIVAGGNGNDHLDGRAGDDALDGGPGNDTVLGGLGPDRVLGGPGDDTLKADLYSNSGIWSDVVDGGDGVDALSEYDFSGEASAAPAVSVTYDGVANDGRPGEGDNLVGVERLVSGSAGSFTGDDGANAITGPETGAASGMDGRGGGDVLIAGDAHGDSINGGAGADELAGGFGDDTLVGGPGPDRISGDRPARCNELHCDIGGGQGNDSIDARDGEIDSIVCGPGTDRVTADAADTVAADCEQVERASGAGGAGGDAATDTSAPSLRASFSRRLRLRTVFSRGMSFALTLGEAARVQTTVSADGRTLRRYRLLTGRRARRARSLTVGRTTRSLAAGRRGVRVKITKKYALKLRRARSLSLKVTITATDAAGNKRTTRKTLKLKR